VSTVAAPTLELAPETWEEIETDDTFIEDEPERPSALELLQGGLGDDDTDVKATFDVLADELAEAMAGAASPRKAMRHPAYAEILALGGDAVPLLVERLGTPGNRPLWLRLLGSLTGYSPGAGQETVPDAATAWMLWARREGRLFGGP
jgi:hypothetical protein